MRRFRFKGEAERLAPGSASPPNLGTPDMGLPSLSVLSPNSVLGMPNGVEPPRPLGPMFAESSVLTRSGLEIQSGDPGLSRRLDDCADHGVIALHGRSVPGYGAVIAEIAVGPSGVYLIDVKHCRSSNQAEGHELSSSRKLAPKSLLSGRERTRIMTKMAWQMEVVRSVLDGLPDARVAAGQPMLALVGAKWGPRRSPLLVDGIYVAWPAKIAKYVSRGGTLSRSSIARIAERLAAELPSVTNGAALQR